jgi:hypothetical protein
MIPDGYLEDSQGRLVPEAKVKTLDKLRTEIVQKLVAGARQQAADLEAFRKHAFSQIADFCELSAAEYGRAWGGQKGNITLTSFDGAQRVDLVVAENHTFDERLQTAKELIDECVRDWSHDSRPELQLLVNDAFQVDKKGNVNTKRILSLRKFDIDDPRWLKAMEAISDSLTVAGTRSYLRFYERGQDGGWRQLPLDIRG